MRPSRAPPPGAFPAALHDGNANRVTKSGIGRRKVKVMDRLTATGTREAVRVSR